MKDKVNKKLVKVMWERLFDSLDELHDKIKEKLKLEKEKQKQPIQSK